MVKFFTKYFSRLESDSIFVKKMYVCNGKNFTKYFSRLESDSILFFIIFFFQDDSTKQKEKQKLVEHKQRIRDKQRVPKDPKRVDKIANLWKEYRQMKKERINEKKKLKRKVIILSLFDYFPFIFFIFFLFIFSFYFSFFIFFLFPFFFLFIFLYFIKLLMPIDALWNLKAFFILHWICHYHHITVFKKHFLWICFQENLNIRWTYLWILPPVNNRQNLCKIWGFRSLVCPYPRKVQ